MKPLGLNEIREKYLEFFETKEHLRLPSASLKPIGDKSLLLINSGMAPLKPYFTGDEIPPRKRVTTCQKCIRTPDIDNVGKTDRHGTFFEMLGNFSFGDYFKEEAIPWAWEFVTEWMEMDPERVHISIYLDDDEAYKIWNEKVGIPPERIVRLGKEDNFWEHGLGPCGPCSELYYDRGEEYGCGEPDCKVGCECDRYIEFWNLVFTQFDKDEEGNYNPLPNPNIDTGMGLERLAVIMQGAGSLFEVDTVGQVLMAVCEKAGIAYHADEEADISIRVITDHIRSVTFMLADDIMPGNEGAGYVLRRLLRRAVRQGYLLNIEEDLFLSDIAKVAIEVSKDAYPELGDKEEFVLKVIDVEEEKFKKTLEQGLTLLEGEIDKMAAMEEKVFPGFGAFKLYDTFGFPLDLTKDIVREKGLEIDEKGFHHAMKEQKEKARTAQAEKNAAVWADDPFNPLGADAVNVFEGYEMLQSPGKILGLVKGEELVQEVKEGDEILVLLDHTAFYAESGGQIGDNGLITNGKENIIEITDCKKGSIGRHIHYGKVIKGNFSVDDMVISKVDRKKRMATQRNHTCTHLLHKALKTVLGEHVTQAGSYVAPDRLRFDFNHLEKMTQEEIDKVEDLVNEAVLESYKVNVFETDINEAKELGAMALFGEKYGEEVRVVQVGDYSIELCGGTHIGNSSEIGMFKLLSESGIAAGVRRIEGATGWQSVEYVNKIEDSINKMAAIMRTTPENVLIRLEEQAIMLREHAKHLEELKGKLAANIIPEIISRAKKINGITAVITEVSDVNDISELRNMTDAIKDKIQSGIVILATDSEGKVGLIASATDDVVKQGFHAGNVLREAAKITGGGGGGRPNLAQAGGKQPEKIGEALEKAIEIVKEQLSE
jgi:alanyl-tRNA synthetase